MRDFTRFVIAAPTFLWGALFVYGAVLLRFAERARGVPPALLTARWRPWWAKRWRYSTTIGRGIIYHPRLFTPVYENGTQVGTAEEVSSPLERIQAHERVHVRQNEDLCAHGLLWALLALLGAQTTLGLLLWGLAPGASLLNYGMAWLRGGDIYRDAEHEKSAYAQTDITA